MAKKKMSASEPRGKKKESYRNGEAQQADGRRTTPDRWWTASRSNHKPRCRTFRQSNSLKANPHGPALLEDFILREKITHFDHERIPRAYRSCASHGVHGFFELTSSLKKYTTARVLTEVGEKTPVFTRISTVAGGAGSVDTPRDVRGFAVKFYTKREIGIWSAMTSPSFYPRRHQVSGLDPCRIRWSLTGAFPNRQPRTIPSGISFR